MHERPSGSPPGSRERPLIEDMASKTFDDIDGDRR
jgi:hypothetical protein